MYTCVGEGEALTEEVDHFFVFKMLIVTGSISLTSVVHDEDFVNINNSFRRCHRQCLVHIKLSKPKKPTKLGALPNVLPLVHSSHYKNSSPFSPRTMIYFKL